MLTKKPVTQITIQLDSHPDVLVDFEEIKSKLSSKSEKKVTLIRLALYAATECGGIGILSYKRGMDARPRKKGTGLGGFGVNLGSHTSARADIHMIEGVIPGASRATIIRLALYIATKQEGGVLDEGLRELVMRDSVTKPRAGVKVVNLCISTMSHPEIHDYFDEIAKKLAAVGVAHGGTLVFRLRIALYLAAAADTEALEAALTEIKSLDWTASTRFSHQNIFVSGTRHISLHQDLDEIRAKVGGSKSAAIRLALHMLAKWDESEFTQIYQALNKRERDSNNPYLAKHKNTS